MSRRLTVRDPAVRQVAKMLRPEAKQLTSDDLNCARLLLLFKAGVGPTGEKVYTFPQAAALMCPEYNDAGSKAKEGYKRDVRRYMLRLTDMSANTRGDSRIGVVPFTDETYKLYRNGEPTMNSIVATYRPGLPYKYIGVFTSMNGVCLVAWAEVRRLQGQGKVTTNMKRVNGWGTAGLLTAETQAQFGESQATQLRLEKQNGPTRTDRKIA